ncbi:tetratricopeptide repeat protein [Dokdonella fugitiva]|jgi:tetratricopeptide (TPR) repeat protein|uniref:MerR-like DNA binding protein n=1 Tax=Dokdonella fugitiva TaxID=328517 RepID=A0A4R2HYG1_9GAMM|nr:tetratricopeptide repeat protein [Dokdonella fugitiva]MBA8885644.1 tetratricopeptide (TPR) repeat protein [Dokdonella fugitiva]TCO36296.1 MerR-like DNA binding protein [Dokdonella fugitiva]
MHSYGVRDVEKLLRLPRSTIRALIAAGFVAPARGSRNAWQFSFQDLIVLRTAQALAAANIPQRRIVRALKDLRARLPEEMPLSGLSIGAIADEVVVREGGARWAAGSGQYLLAFENDPDAGSLRVIEPAPARAAAREGADDGSLERRDSAAALAAYDAAIAADPSRVDARINKGRLLHELGRYEEAVRTYLDALEAGIRDALLHYNLGVLLDDLDRKPQARKAYEAALSLDPQMADAHYNLALLCEELDQPREAIRHMAQYRRLLARG